MKRKFLTALVIAGGLFLTACQEDSTMDELIENTEMNAMQGDNGTGSGSGNGSQGSGSGTGGN